jgi:hypothetical protein
VVDLVRHEVAGRDAECPGQRGEVGGTQGVRGRFEAVHGLPVQAGQLSENFLGQLPLEPERADPESEGDQEGLRFRCSRWMRHIPDTTRRLYCRQNELVADQPGGGACVEQQLAESGGEIR